MKISKQDLKDISQLIFDGYLSTDVFLADTYFTIRTLRTEERHKLFTRYKYLFGSQNFFIMMELLSISIKSIGGIEVEDNKIFQKLLRSRSLFTLFLYKESEMLEKSVFDATKVDEARLLKDSTDLIPQLINYPQEKEDQIIVQKAMFGVLKEWCALLEEMDEVGVASKEAAVVGRLLDDIMNNAFEDDEEE